MNMLLMGAAFVGGLIVLYLMYTFFTEPFTGGRGTSPNIHGGIITSKGQLLQIPSDQLAYGDHARPDNSLLSGHVNNTLGANHSHTVHTGGEKCHVALTNNFPPNMAHAAGMTFSKEARGEAHALHAVGAMPPVYGADDYIFTQILHEAADPVAANCIDAAVEHPPPPPADPAMAGSHPTAVKSNKAPNGRGGNMAGKVSAVAALDHDAAGKQK